MTEPKLPSETLILLVHDRDRRPVIPEPRSSEAAARQQVGADRPSRGYLWDERAGADELPRQRWGVIAPEGAAGDRLLAAIAPLIARRREQCGGEPIAPLRVPPDMDAAAAMKWYKRYFEPGSVFRDKIPRYVLILGDLDQVSLELQQVVGATAFVGRLAFESADEYAAYAAKVLRAEDGPAATRPPRALLHAVEDGTTATESGRRVLCEPGAELLRGAGVEVGDLAREATPEELRRAARGETGGVLFTVSHGIGAPRGGWSSPAEQRRRQGAMSLGERGDLAGDALRGGAFVPGGLWFMFACFSAGTPATSAYTPWLELLAAHAPGRIDPRVALASLPPAGSPPFVAALPKAALASTDGPLAFIGHVDLAWTYAFRETHEGVSRAHPARFMAVLRAARDGARVGVAFRELYRYFEQTNTELSTLDTSRLDAAAAQRRGALWMLRQDLAGYVLLGDPAVRLAGLGDAAPRPASAPAATTTATPQARVDPRAFIPFASTAPARARIDPAAVERAAARVILGEDASAVAAQLGLDAKELARAIEAYRKAGRRAIDG